MQTGIKLLLAAVLSLSVGVAFATPLYIADMNIKPFPRNPEGPKADTSISVVYANFTISPANTYTVPPNSIMNSSISTSTLNYEIVLNVTNLSNLGAQIERLGIIAAQDIAVVNTSVGFVEYNSESTNVGGVNGGGHSSGTATSDDIVPGTQWGHWSQFKDGKTQAGGSGLVTGVWLDGNWINITWIPGTNYPRWPTPSGGWFPPNATYESIRDLPRLPSLSETWPTTKTIPDLPANATIEGTWIEGVPIIEMHNITTAPGKTLDITTVTGIFINGTWVDVTGRVTTAHKQHYARVTNIVAGERRYFGGEPPFAPNFTRNETRPWDEAMANAQKIDITYTKTGEAEFTNYWAPNQSRLIMLKGSRELLPNWGLDSLTAGKVTLLAEEFNCVNDPSVNNTALYTFSGGHWLYQVQVQRTANSYVYNTILDANQMFESDQWGVEVFIKPRS